MNILRLFRCEELSLSTQEDLLHQEKHFVNMCLSA